MKVRHFEKQAYDRAIREYEIRIDALNKLNKLTQGLTFDEYCDKLNSSTGFKNTRMSADALGLIDEYETAERLHTAALNIDTSLLVTDKGGFKLSTAALNDLRDRYTTYHTSQDEIRLKVLNDTAEALTKAKVSPRMIGALRYEARTNEWEVCDRTFSTSINTRG